MLQIELHIGITSALTTLFDRLRSRAVVGSTKDPREIFIENDPRGEADMGFGGFSWKRATGITRLKTGISRSTRIPLTRSGRERQLGALMTGGLRAGGKGSGCLLVIIAAMLLTFAVAVPLLR